MAKRHADDILITSSPSKRYRGLCMSLESTAPSDPPSLLPFLGSRCRKRHFFFTETDGTDLDVVFLRKGTHGHNDLLKQTAQLNTMPQQLQTSGNFQERQISAIATNANKRPREDSEAPADTAKAKVDAETTDIEDSSYNTFQFWRTPLPELDMSLLQIPPQKDCDAMET